MNSHFKNQTSALLSLFLPETHGAPLPDTPEQSEEVDDDDDNVDGDDDDDDDDDDSDGESMSWSVGQGFISGLGRRAAPPV